MPNGAIDPRDRTTFPAWSFDVARGGLQDFAGGLFPF